MKRRALRDHSWRTGW